MYYSIVNIHHILFKNLLRHFFVLGGLVLVFLYGSMAGSHSPDRVDYREGSLESVLEAVECIKAAPGTDPSGVILRRADGYNHYSQNRKLIDLALNEEIAGVEWPAQDAVKFCQ